MTKSLPQLKKGIFTDIGLNRFDAFVVKLKILKRIDFKDRHGFSMLHLAVEMGRVRYVKVLLEKGIPVDIRDKNKNTSLLNAVKDGRKNQQKTEIIHLLLNAEAGPNYKKSPNSYSILHEAMRNRHLNVTLIEQPDPPSLGFDLLDEHTPFIALITVDANGRFNLNLENRQKSSLTIRYGLEIIDDRGNAMHSATISNNISVVKRSKQAIQLSIGKSLPQ